MLLILLLWFCVALCFVVCDIIRHIIRCACMRLIIVCIFTQVSLDFDKMSNAVSWASASPNHVGNIIWNDLYLSVAIYSAAKNVFRHSAYAKSRLLFLLILLCMIFIISVHVDKISSFWSEINKQTIWSHSALIEIKTKKVDSLLIFFTDHIKNKLDITCAILQFII